MNTKNFQAGDLGIFCIRRDGMKTKEHWSSNFWEKNEN